MEHLLCAYAVNVLCHLVLMTPHGRGTIFITRRVRLRGVKHHQHSQGSSGRAKIWTQDYLTQLLTATLYCQGREIVMIKFDN